MEGDDVTTPMEAVVEDLATQLGTKAYEVAHWRVHAQILEARVEELEGKLAEREMVIESLEGHFRDGVESDDDVEGEESPPKG